MDLKDYRILIVDDHMLIRRMVGATLKEMGITNFDEAVDGKSALDKIQASVAEARPYNIIFLDWNIPNPNGYDILVACRKDRKLDKTAIVMLTAEAVEHRILKLLEAGATAYLGKPFKPEVLIKKVDDIAKWHAGKVNKAAV